MTKLLSRFYVLISLKKINNQICLGVVLYFDKYIILLKNIDTELGLIHACKLNQTQKEFYKG
jgi:hypothetical protein